MCSRIYQPPRDLSSNNNQPFCGLCHPSIWDCRSGISSVHRPW
jgi:hypothetical protein